MRYKTPVVLQMEATECGAASLAMVLGYYGRFESLEKLRFECGVSRNGSKASLIVKAAQSYGLEASGYQVDIEDLPNFKGPSILFWEFCHYVVYEGQSKDGKYFYINDPAMGPRVVDRELFEKSFTGVLLSFTPTKDFIKNNKPQGVLSTMFGMLTSFKGLLALVIWGGMLLVLPGLAVPALMQTYVDYVLVDGSDWTVNIVYCFLMAIILQIFLTYIVDLALRRGQLQIGINRTLYMLDYLFKLPINFFLQRGNADIQQRISLNTKVAATAFGVLAENFVKFFTAIFFLILMLSFSLELTVLSIIFALIDIGLLFILIHKRQIINQSLLSLETKMVNAILSGLGSIESLKTSGRENAIFTKWLDNLTLYNSKKLEFEVFTTYYNLIPALIQALGVFGILVYGTYLVINGQLTVGGLFAFQTLSSSFVAPFTALLLSSAELTTMKADIERIKDVYTYDAKGVFCESKKYCDEELVTDSAQLELKNVSFKYASSEPLILKDFNLKLFPGKRVAIVGPSGSGKSTVAKLIAGIIAPTSGEITLNSHPYSDYTAEQFYLVVSIVDQSISMFSGSIADNLTIFAKHYEMQGLYDALKDSCMMQDLANKGSILGQNVAEGGRNFSGGQRQRLEIARVLAYNTPLMIFDEASSALDPITEEQIDKAIIRRKVTSVIVAHRLSTIRDADEIIVLDKGQIAEQGTHDELMAKNGVYKKMMSLEDNKDEV